MAFRVSSGKGPLVIGPANPQQLPELTLVRQLPEFNLVRLTGSYRPRLRVTCWVECFESGWHVFLRLDFSADGVCLQTRADSFLFNAETPRDIPLPSPHKDADYFTLTLPAVVKRIQMRHKDVSDLELLAEEAKESEEASTCSTR